MYALVLCRSIGLSGVLVPPLPMLPILPILLATVADSEGIECTLVDLDLILPADLLEGADELEAMGILL